MKTISSKKVNKSRIIGLKEFRNNTEVYIRRVKKGESFSVVRRSQPVFKMVPLDDDDDSLWESLDLRDKNGRGMPAQKFLKILQKVIHEQDRKISQKD